MKPKIWQLKAVQDCAARCIKIAALWGALVIVLSSPICGRAQSITTSQINGTVADNTGAVVPGATVTVTNSATGVTYHMVTDGMGAYHVTDLLPGTYTMDVAKTGFETEHIQAFTLIVGQLFQQNIALAVGQAVQTVSVNAAALLLNTEASHDEQLIEGRQIEDMPLNGRDYLQLAQLDAGVVPVSVSGINSPASAWGTAGGVVAVDISGLKEDDNSYLFDGIETRNAWYGTDALLPDPDMVQEFVMMNSAAPRSTEWGERLFPRCPRREPISSMERPTNSCATTTSMRATISMWEPLPHFTRTSLGQAWEAPSRGIRSSSSGTTKGSVCISRTTITI